QLKANTLSIVRKPIHRRPTGKRFHPWAPMAPPSRETTMLRKLSLAAVAAVSLGAAALAPTTASAWGGYWHPGWPGGYFHTWGSPRFYVGGPGFYGYGGCYVRRNINGINYLWRIC